MAAIASCSNCCNAQLVGSAWRPAGRQHPCSIASTSSRSDGSRHAQLTQCLVPRAATSNGAGAGAGAGGAGYGGNSKRGSSGRGERRGPRRARDPGMYEVKVVTPPPRSLGIYALPPNTHNGEEIEIDGQGYVVTSTVLQYKLVKGRYVRDHNRLEVAPTGRYFLNMMLDNLMHARYVGPTGEQD